MKTARQLSIAILVVVSVCNLYFGIRMILDPSGSALGLPFYLLNGTIFKDYTLPGWILLLAFGVLSLITIIIITRRYKWYPVAVIVQGAVVTACVITQMVILGDDYFLQYFFLMTGMFLIALGALQYQMRKTEEPRSSDHMVQKKHKHRH